MALYKNDVIFELSRFPKEVEYIETYFHGKFPVKMIYPPERVIPSRLKHNRKPDKPASMSFDLKATVKTPNGIEVWRYAEQIIVDEKGHKRYVPKKFMFQGSKYIDRNDIELLFFLLRKSEYCRGGDNEGPMVKFMFEDLVTEAEKRAEKKRLEAKVNKFLWDDEYALTEDKIRAVAKAYQITGIDTFTLSQVKNMLGDRIFSTKEGPGKFFEMINDDEQIKARMSITRAMDMGLIHYDAVKKSWYWKVGENVTSITKVPPSKTPNEALYDYYQGNDAFKEDINAAILTKNPNAGKKKEKVVEE